MALEQVQELFDFIEKSPSCFHVIDNVKKTLVEEGFEELFENKKWQLQEGGKYFVTRNLSSIIAFKVPGKDFASFHIIASHSDSPTFKIKDNPEQQVKGKYVQLNTEKYGGMIFSTWFDRPLSVAGRALVKTDKGVETKLVNIDRDLVVIPNLAIHLDRTANDGMKYNPQVNLLPLYGDAASKDTFDKLVAEACGVQEEDLLSTDLFLYNRMKPAVWGAHHEYMSCAKLDDLECAFSSLKAFVKGGNKESVSVCAIFDNEEVGSSSRMGAASSYLRDVLDRILEAVPHSAQASHRAMANSFMLSADNAHATHPNFPQKSDPCAPVRLGGGVVLKYNASQKYTTNAVSGAIFRAICRKAGVPVQVFTNRADEAGGSTLGNLQSHTLPIPMADIGCAQFAMHSAVETASVADAEAMTKAVAAFYRVHLRALGDGTYTLE